MGNQASKSEDMSSINMTKSSDNNARNKNDNNNNNSVQFSPSFLDYLQNNPETDSTRAKALEVEIQTRVNAELHRLQEMAVKEYAEVQSKMTEEETLTQETDKSTEAKAGDRLRQLGKEAVQGDIKELQSKIEKSKRVREVDQQVVKAKTDVITCLMENDRRPLDCWAQVEKFKQEVAKMEDGWIQKVVS